MILIIQEHTYRDLNDNGALKILRPSVWHPVLSY